MYKVDLALINLQWLICHKTKANHLLFIVSRSDYAFFTELLITTLFSILHKTLYNERAEKLLRSDGLMPNLVLKGPTWAQKNRGLGV